MSATSTPATTSEAVNLISVLMQMGNEHSKRSIPFLLVGDPGVAKTESIAQIAARLSEVSGKQYAAEVWSATQIGAEELGGLPVPNMENRAVDLLSIRVGKRVQESGRGLVAIDELGSVSHAFEGAALNFFCGGMLGETILPQEVALGAMMNPEDIASNARALSIPAQNRFLWIEWVMDINQWLSYMSGGRGIAANVALLPPDWEENYGLEYSNLVGNYVRVNSTHLVNKPKLGQDAWGWASPRSWYELSRVLAALAAAGFDIKSREVHTACVGLVGHEVGKSMFKWISELDLPDPADLLRDPSKAPSLIPPRPDKLSLSLTNLARYCADRNAPDAIYKWDNGWKVIGPYLDTNPDLALPAAQILANQKPAGAKSPAARERLQELVQLTGKHQTGRSR